MRFSPRTILTVFASVALAGGAAALVVDAKETMRLRDEEIAATTERAIEARRTLLAKAQVEGTRNCFKADAGETTNVDDCDVAVWTGIKDQLTVMPTMGPFAGVAVVFQPAAEKGALRLRHLGKEEKITVADQSFSLAALSYDPVEYLYGLRDFSSAPDSSVWYNKDVNYTKVDGKHRLFRVTGAIAKGRPFEIAFGRQHKLAINLKTGNFVFNTYAQPTFYGRIPVFTPEGDRAALTGLRP